MARKRHRLPRIVTWSAGLALVSVVVAAMTVKFFIAPHVIRSQINSNLSERWDGRADIKSIGFSWPGAVRVDGIDLYRPVYNCVCQVTGGAERSLQP